MSFGDNIFNLFKITLISTKISCTYIAESSKYDFNYSVFY